jgi:hypothetical protein
VEYGGVIAVQDVGMLPNFHPVIPVFKSAAIVSLKKICWPKKIASVIYII